MSGPIAPWVFRQLGGDKKELVLEGADAPYGRPRQKPIVEDGIDIREKRKWYAGNDVPTRHIFGVKYHDIELSGRWMDRNGGPGWAQEKSEFVKRFVADAQECRITWGDIISTRGLIRSFIPRRESREEVAWHMVVGIDADEILTAFAQRQDPAPVAPGKFVDNIGELLAKALKPSTEQPEQFKGSFAGGLDASIAGVTSAFASLVLLATSVSSFEQELIGDIRRFRAGIGQLQTALIIFRDGYQDFRNDLAIQGDYADDQLKFAGLQADSGLATLQALEQLIAADRAAAEAERGKIIGFYEAKEGDSWESIARYVYDGSASRAEDLRMANGIPPGAPPVAGGEYQVPR